jgi:hypothetical protein
VSFVAFSWYSDGCAVLWTDEAGAPLAVLSEKRVFHRDSMNNISYISAGRDGGEVRAFYNARGVRYWSRDGKDYEFRRDGRGLVLRLMETSDVTVPPLNYSYDYSFGGVNGDATHSAWTERRELRWTVLDGYLAASPGDVVTRVIE